MKLNSDQQQRWEQHLTGLLAYKERFGHCKVPRLWPEDPHLGEWVYNQRKKHRHGRLQPEHFDRLDQIGFVWQVHPQPAASWEQRVARLVAFKERFGHCNVPRHWPEDPQLGEWVATQRRSRNRRQLQPDRIYQLDRLGFKWRLAALSKPAMRSLPKDLAALNRRWDKQLAEWRLADQLLP